MSRITSFIFVTVIVLILNACFMPAEVQTLLEDDKVREIIQNKKTGAVVDIFPPDTADHKPLLLAGGLPLEEGALVAISADAPITIMVSNADEYISIEWYYDDDDSFFIGDSVSTLIPPFDTAGWYTIFVVGTATDGLSYSTFFNIDVGD